MKLLGNSRIEKQFAIHFILSRAFFLGNFWVIYLVSKGFSLVDAAYMDFVFWGTLLVFEIPTGYVADVFGRKISVILSMLLQSFGIFLFAIAETFETFLLSYAIWAFAITLQSGAEEAWLYDEVTFQFGDDTKYQQIFGRLLGISAISSAIAGILSGFIAEVDLVFTIYATSVMFILSAIWLFFIPHNRRIKDETDDTSIKSAIKSIYGVKYLALLTIVVTATILVIAFWFQTYLDDSNVPYIFIGLILSIGSILIAIGGRFSERLSDKFGPNTVVILPIILSPIIILMSFQLPAAIVGYWLIHVFRGLWNPLFSRIINARLATSVRATSLSIIGAMGTIIIVSTELYSALVIEQNGYNFMYFYLGLVVGIVLLLLVLIMKVTGSLEREEED